MATWTADKPGDGDMTMIRGFATRMSDRITELQDLIADVGTASSEGAGASVFTGSAATAWADRAPALEAPLRTIIDELAGRRDAANAYAGAVDRIKTDAAAVWVSRGPVLRGLTTWYQSAPDYQDSVVGRSRKDSLDARQVSTRRQLDELVSQRATADSTFVSAMTTDVTINGWSSSAVMSIVGGFPTFGAPSAEEIQRLQAVAAAARISSDEAGLTWEEDWVRIEAYLTDNANDPEELSRYYRALGGDGTATLTYMSALMGNPPDYALTIQSTFAAASYEWTDAQAQRMADDMVAACVGYGGSVAVLAFLLHGGASAGKDYPLVSSTAASAFATAVYKTETGTVDANPLWTLDANGDAFYAWYIREVLTPEGDYSVTDSPVPYMYDSVGDVILTLSAYPDDALAWAYDNGDPAHTEWLYTRSWADGYEAPMTLLLRIQDATGGIYDTSAAYDSAETSQIMEVTGRAMVGLTMGDAAISAPMLSDEASVTLASAVGGLSPYFADTLTHDYNGNGIPVDASIWVLGADGPVEAGAPTPNVSQGVYVQILTLIAPNDDAWSVYTGAVNEYQGAVFAMMGAGGDPPMDAMNGLNYVGAFQAVVDAVPVALTEMGAISDAEADGKMVDMGAAAVQQVVSKGLTAATGGTAAPWANLAGTGAKMLIGECGDLWVDQRLDAAMQASVDASFDAKAAFMSNLDSMLASADSPWMDGKDPLVTGPAGETSRVAQDYEEAKVNVGRLVDSDYAEAEYLRGLEG